MKSDRCIFLPCLVPRHQYCARPMRFGSRDPSEFLSHSSLTPKQHSLKKRSTPIPAPAPTPRFTLLCWLVGPEIHNSKYAFLFYDILIFFTTLFLESVFSSKVFCSWYWFPGCCNCNFSKTNWDVPELFSIPPPPPPPPNY